MNDYVHFFTPISFYRNQGSTTKDGNALKINSKGFMVYDDKKWWIDEVINDEFTNSPLLMFLPT